ncbi:NAD-dependent DNA ligase LigA [Myxococcota bacterium]|nr:NAD-dependent DNA ligase LigA [Myxococcota bacterium]MBU1534239.1 NAD-dependent DNA ligase LigA [Myxococcota bacterium]
MTTENSLKTAHLELCREIERHNRLYYGEFAPEISDQAYDQLLKKLEQMEAEYPHLVAPYSPTQRVGTVRSEGESFVKVAHEIPLLSLSNTYDINDINKFIQRITRGLAPDPAPDGATEAVAEKVELVVEPKYDGISIELLYEEGVFVRAVTRGDGQVGDDITANVRTIRDVPSLLAAPFPPRLVVRGEIYLTFENFERLNTQREVAGELLFMNPRNAAGGALHLKDPREVAERNLSCFVYDILTTHEEYPFHVNVLSAMEAMGFMLEAHPVVIDTGGDCQPIIEALLHDWERRRNELPYPVDGLVFKVNSLAQRAKLGTNVKDPKWGFAFKFAADRLSTTLVDVELQVGRTGAVTPVAILEPVLLDGSRVSRASLHNFEYIEKMGLMLGDLVMVEKAAEIIPQVVSVVNRGEDSRPIVPPTNCPECQTPLIRRKLGVKEAADEGGILEKVLRCTNTRCPARKEQELIHFVKRENMNMDALGEKLVSQLVHTGLVGRPSDLYSLTFDDLCALERVGPKLARKVLDSIRASVSNPFPRVLGALGIPGVGKSTARLIAEYFGDMGGLMAVTDETAQEHRLALLEIKGIGEVLASDVVDWLLDPVVRDELSVLRRVLAPKSMMVATGGSLAGQKLCVTGTLSRPREEIHRLIEEAGGSVTTSVSKTLDFLVCGEKAGSKERKARDLGIQILTEAQFNRLLAEGIEAQEESTESGESQLPLF